MAKAISFKLKFIDSIRFMASSLSNLVENIVEETHNVKCKYRQKKAVKNKELNTKIVSAFLNTQTLKMIY